MEKKLSTWIEEAQSKLPIVKKELGAIQLQAKQLMEGNEILQVRSYNKALTQKAVDLEKKIIYLEDQLESER